MTEISTSILSVKEDAIKTFYNLETAKTDYFHIDVMDGKFVEDNNLVKMKDYALSLKHITNIPLDVHLMVENVQEIVEEFLELEPHIISFHIEAVKNKEETLELIKYIKENNVKVGLVVNSNTDIEKIYEFLPYIHLVLVMTVEAGKGGQKLIPENIYKIEQISPMISPFKDNCIQHCYLSDIKNK